MICFDGRTVAVTNESEATGNNYCRDRRAGSVARFLHFRRTRRVGLIHFSVGLMRQATIQVVALGHSGPCYAVKHCNRVLGFPSGGAAKPMGRFGKPRTSHGEPAHFAALIHLWINKSHKVVLEAAKMERHSISLIARNEQLEIELAKIKDVIKGKPKAPDSDHKAISSAGRTAFRPAQDHDCGSNVYRNASFGSACTQVGSAGLCNWPDVSTAMWSRMEGWLRPKLAKNRIPWTLF